MGDDQQGGPPLPLQVQNDLFDDCGIGRVDVGRGLIPMQEMCDDMIYIKQYGSVRSINAGSASAVILNDYVTKYERKMQ